MTNNSIENQATGTSLVVQCLRIYLAMQGTQVPSLVKELRSHMLGSNSVHMLQLLKPMFPKERSLLLRLRSDAAISKYVF